MLKNSTDKSLMTYDYVGACTFYLFAIIATLICQALAGVVSAGLARSYPDIANNGDFNTGFMVFIQLVNAAFIYFYTRLRRRKFDFTFFNDGETGARITPACFIVPILVGAALMCAMYLPTVWYGFLMRAIGLPADYGEIELTTPSAVAMLVIVSVLLAPAMEETIYRGVLFHGLKRKYNIFGAAALSALAFMLMHMNPMQVVFQFALGFVCALVAARSKRLFPAMLTHATTNALALVIQMTSLGVTLDGCGEWLTNNVAAAVFITLGLFVAGGAVVFALVTFGFGVRDGKSLLKRAKKSSGDSSADGEKTSAAREQSADEKVRDIVAKAKSADGTVKYWIAAGLSIIMWIVNLVSGLLL